MHLWRRPRRDLWPIFGLCKTDHADRRSTAARRGHDWRNIANGSPIGDTMPVLIALASRFVSMKEQTRRTLQLEDFYFGYRKTALEPCEFLVKVQIPKSASDLVLLG